jgi:hypothetical protein
VSIHGLVSVFQKQKKKKQSQIERERERKRERENILSDCSTGRFAFW